MKKLNLNNQVLDKIANSFKINEKEKLSLLRHIAYLTKSEQKELVELL